MPLGQRLMRHKDAWSVFVTTVALLIYGVLQERVMTRGWGGGDSHEHFPHSAFLVLCNRLLTVLVLVVHMVACGHSCTLTAPVKSYCMVSASNMVSTLCQYEALKYVSFVTQTLAKTAKALPVVLWGTVYGGKRYKAEQYIHAVLITAGCSVFVLGGDITSAVADRNSGTWWTYAMGMCLLLIYLATDGWTSTQQEHLFKAYSTSIQEQLLFTTTFSLLYSLVATVASGQLVPATQFLMRHPSAAWAVLALSAMSTIIQVCISHVLQQHGALVFALMMTTRQCVSVLLSSLLFNHALSMSQWLGVALVFSSLYHQKARGTGGSSSSNRRTTAGKLPQSRQSAAGIAPQSKQVAHALQQSNRGVSSTGTAAAAAHKPAVSALQGAAIHTQSTANMLGTAFAVVTSLQPAFAGLGANAAANSHMTPRHTGHQTQQNVRSHAGLVHGAGVAEHHMLLNYVQQPLLASHKSLPPNWRKLWTQGSGQHAVLTAKAEEHRDN